MGKNALLILLSFIFLAGCAANRESVAEPGDYVEIDNPALTMSPNAPPTIMVPRRYVESGVPRGSEAIKQGIEALRGSGSESPAQQQPAQTAAAVPAPAQAPVPVAAPVVLPPAPVQPAPVKSAAVAPVLNRLFVVEVGNNALLSRFNSALKKETAGITMDATQAAFVARYAPVASPADRSTLAVKLQEDFGANLILYLSAPEGVASGKPLAVDVYEGNGGALVKTLETLIPAHSATDAAAREASVSSALRGLARDVKGVAALMPWYGKVVSVEGERVYLSAGKESGISVGQILHVYRPGKVVEKLGFAPGRKVGTLRVTGFVGTDGAFGITKEGEKAQVSDLLGLE